MRLTMRDTVTLSLITLTNSDDERQCVIRNVYYYRFSSLQPLDNYIVRAQLVATKPQKIKLLDSIYADATVMSRSCYVSNGARA